MALHIEQFVFAVLIAVVVAGGLGAAADQVVDLARAALQSRSRVRHAIHRCRFTIRVIIVVFVGRLAIASARGLRLLLALEMTRV